VFRVVVVPRYSIEVEKGEKLIPILLKPPFVLDYHFALKIRIRYLKEKPLNISLVLSEKTGFETKSINGLDNRLYDGGKFSDHLGQLDIEWLLA
jgi:hypothetical protein